MRASVLLLFAACGGPALYELCDEPGQCHVPEGVTAECLDNDGAEGFCTWSCAEDSDCTEVADDPYLVCASFSSTEGKFCFPGCEDAAEGEEVCPRGLECSSTGGGNENRKVCAPP